jgi:non-heme chloroperoxidase
MTTHACNTGCGGPRAGGWHIPPPTWARPDHAARPGVRRNRAWPLVPCGAQPPDRHAGRRSCPELVGFVGRPIPRVWLPAADAGLARRPGHGRSSPHQSRPAAGKGIDEIVEHYAQIIAGLSARPVVVGHSFGGLIAQRLLGQDLAAAAVAIDPAPIKGVIFLPPSALRVASIALRRPANRNEAVSLTAEQFRYGFGNAVGEQESGELYQRWAIPSPGRPLFEAAMANFAPHSPAKVNTGNKTRGPLLITAGGRDHTVPAAISHATRRLYHKSPAVTDLREFPDRGHSLTIDHGWREVAQTVLDWLNERVP